MKKKNLVIWRQGQRPFFGRTHRDGSSRRPPVYKVPHGGVPHFKINQWTSADISDLLSIYPGLIIYPMPEPCFPGKYWKTLKASAEIKFSTRDGAKTIYNKRHFRYGIEKLPGRFFEKEITFNDVIDSSIGGPEHSSLFDDMNTVEIMRNTYGYMGYQMNRAEITTPNDPSLWRMVDNGLRGLHL